MSQESPATPEIHLPETIFSSNYSPTTKRSIDQMLMFAWQRFNDYDLQACKSKKGYTRFRQSLIVVSMVTTYVAVASTMSFVQYNLIVSNMVNVILIILPLIGAGLLSYATRFESGKDWVGYRIAAESIRRGIYSLRIKVWLNIATEADLKNLDNLINDTGESLKGLGVTTPAHTNPFSLDQTEVTPNWVDVPEKDNGYTPMSLYDYIHFKIAPQINWYRYRVKYDYRRTRMGRAVILVVSGIGVLLTALGWSTWGTATTMAGVNGLIATLNLSQSETNYRNYMRTVRKIENALRHFGFTFGDYNRPLEELTVEEKSEILDFVREIETIFNNERDVWRASVLQVQDETESSIARMVNAYNTTGFDADALLGISDFPDTE